jgi:predicted RNase H-like nuclease (RuvC/YqgF family)
MGTIRGQYSVNSWKTKLRKCQKEKKYLAKKNVRNKLRIAELKTALKEQSIYIKNLEAKLLEKEQLLGQVPAGHQ